MIEDIQALRQAARLTPDNENQDEKVWCIAAGNVNLIDDIAYKAIASKHSVKILFREHVILKDKRLNKKFDFIMLHGETSKIRELSMICKENGGAYLKIAPYYVKDEPNLMLTVGPDNSIKNFVGNCEKNNIKLSFLIEDQTTGFIETDVYITNMLPRFIRNTIDPLFKMADVALSTVLLSSEDQELPKIKELARSNKIFLIEFNKILKED